MSGHTATPLPWAVYKGSSPDPFSPLKSVWSPSEGALVARTHYHTPEIAEANAAFIVTACNSHADLVKALESFLLPTPINDEMLTFAWKAYNAATTGETRAALATLTARKVG